MKPMKHFLSCIYPFGFKYDFQMLLKNAIPLVLTNLNTFLLPMVSLLFCGHIGTDELAAVSLAVTLINIFGLSNAHGFSNACDTIFPQVYGSKNKKNLGIELQKGLIITAISSLPAMGIVLNSKNLMVLLKQKKEIILLLDEYMLVYMPSILFYGTSVVLSRYAQCQNRVYPVLGIYFFVNAINSGLHALFIYRFEMGVRGAAVAVTISNAILPLLLLLYIYLSRIHTETWAGWSWKCLENWKGYYKLAIPGLFMLLIEFLSYEIGTILCSLLDTIDLGAQSIAQQILVLIYMIPYGIGAAGNIHIGHLLGSNKAQEAQNAYRVVLTITAVSIVVIIMTLLATLNYLPYAFTSDVELATLASNILYLIAALHLFDATQGMLSGVIKAVGAQFYGAIMSFVGFYLIGLPIGLSLMLKTKLRVYGFWIGMISGLFVLATLQIIYTLKINWRKEAYKAIVRAQLEEKEQMQQDIEQLKPLNGETQTRQSNSSDNVISSSHLRILLLKRAVLCVLIVISSCCFIFTRELLPIPESSIDELYNNATNITTITPLMYSQTL